MESMQSKRNGRHVSLSQNDLPAKRRREKNERWFVGILTVLGLLVVVLFLFGRALVIRVYYIPSGAMRPTLKENDRLLANVVYYNFHQPKRGEVAIFRAPREALGLNETHLNKVFIKRIIGTGGDTVEVREGKVYVNGRALSEPYIAERPKYNMKIVDGQVYEILPYSEFPVQRNGLPVEDEKQIARILAAPSGRVPKDAVLVLGDNRNDSNDSHRWGFLPKENLIGKAMFVFYPEYRKL